MEIKKIDIEIVKPLCMLLEGEKYIIFKDRF